MENKITVDPEEFGIEETKAAQISAQFKPMLDKMTELEKEYNEIIKLPIEDKETSAKAKELRLKYVKVRTGTVAIHKEQKEFYLKAGRFIDGWKNTQQFASEGIETKLEAIEKHFENLEKQRISELRTQRIDILKQYDVDGTYLQLGAKAEAELSKGDAAKFQSLIDDMESLKVKYSFKSKKYKTYLEGVNISMDKIINWAISKQ